MNAVSLQLKQRKLLLIYRILVKPILKITQQGMHQTHQQKDLSELEICLINQNEQALLESITQKSTNIYLQIQSIKQINYLYSDQRKKLLQESIQNKNQQLNVINLKNNKLLYYKLNIEKQIKAKIQLRQKWKKQQHDSKFNHCLNIQKQLMMQQSIDQTLKIQNQTAVFQDQIKIINPKIKFMKQKRTQLQKKQNDLRLQISKRFVDLQYLRNKTANNKQNQANLSNIKKEESVQRQNSIKNGLKSMKKTERKSTEPNSQSKNLQYKKFYIVDPFCLNV